tara:strand:- start:316 stop:939 length:624 start_codon:yes stop_codon:yes gene_type:complete
MMFQIKNLIFKSEDRTVLSLEGYSIEANNHLLLLGNSGCGKTTLINLLGGLMRPNSGEVSFEGTDYSTLSETAIDRLRAENFGFVFQRLHLIGHLSVVQNIALAQHKPDLSNIQILITDLGLEGKENQKARDLSVGEAQRVAIARAVANTPKVIFADEPTSALDDQNAENVMNLIFGQAQKTGATVIAATHDARIKNRFTSVLEMSA